LIGWEGKIVSKYLPIVCLALFIFGCGQDESSIIPETHPAYEFYQIAKSGPTTLNVPAQGVAIIKQKSTGDSFLGVSFGEGGIVVTVKMCCWPK
jgi:hypothetical protein